MLHNYNDRPDDPYSFYYHPKRKVCIFELRIFKSSLTGFLVAVKMLVACLNFLPLLNLDQRLQLIKSKVDGMLTEKVHHG